MKVTSALLLLTISTLAAGMNTDDIEGSTFQDRPAKRQRIIEPSEFPSTVVFNDFESAEDPPQTAEHQRPSLIPIDEVLDDFTINEDAAPSTPLADRKTRTPNIAAPLVQADNEGNSDDDSASPRGKERRFFELVGDVWCKAKDKIGIYNYDTPISGPKDCGRDSYFKTRHRHINYFGLADGKEDAVNPNEPIFSQAFMNNAWWKARWESSLTQPRSLIRQAFEVTTKHDGSTSSAIVLRFDQSRATLMTGKVGDAEYLIVRNQKVIYESANKASSRNPGLQRLDPKVDMDVNSVCQINEHRLIKGDIVIAGTAGFFDHVPTIQILEVLQPNYQKIILPEAKISKELKPIYNTAVAGFAKILVNTAERNILKQQNLGHFVRDDDISVFAFTVIRNTAQKRPR